MTVVKTMLVAGLLISFSAVLSARPGLEFTQYASSEGRYKILFPGGVKTETTEVKTPTGIRKVTLDSVQVNDSITFLVTRVDVPDAVAQEVPGSRLDKIRDANKGTNGKVIRESDVQLGFDKLPGRDVLIEKPNNYVRNRIVIAGNRLYQVMIEGSRDFVISKDADRFIESFEVTR